jgi:hypothetical protein
MSLSGEEPKAPMSLSGEEPRAPMSLSGEPRLSHRSAALLIVMCMTATGALLGVLWFWLAPPIHGVVALAKSGQRVHAYLGDEADNLFVSAAILGGLLVILAVVSAVAVWQWRPHRGPQSLAGLWIGAVLGASAAALVGAAMAHWRYGGSLDINAAPVSPEHRVFYFTEAPPVFFGSAPLQMATTLLLPAALAALSYALMAVATPRDDLGGWPPVDHLPPTSSPLPAYPAGGTGFTS